MSDDITRLKSLWHSLPSSTNKYNSEQMKARAVQFQAKHKRRDVGEYLGFAALIGLIIFYLILRADPKAVIAACLAVLGGVVMIWNYNRIAKVKTLPNLHSDITTLDYLRRELTRQRDAAASAWRWYILPVVPFFIYVTVFRWMEEGSTLLELTNTRIDMLFVLTTVIAVLMAIVFWQFLNAARYQRQLDELGQDMNA